MSMRGKGKWRERYTGQRTEGSDRGIKQKRGIGGRVKEAGDGTGRRREAADQSRFTHCPGGQLASLIKNGPFADNVFMRFMYRFQLFSITGKRDLLSLLPSPHP